MGVKLLHPRRRSLIFKMLMFCTFLGFVGLWYKNDEPGIDTPAELEPRKDSQQDSLNLIQDSDKAKFHGHTDKPDHLPGPILEVSNRIEQGEAAGIPAPVLQNILPPKPPNLPSPQDAAERMRAEMWFLEDERKVVRGMGEGGKLVKLSGEEGKLAEEVMKKEAFNLILSDKISVNRTVPDSRDPL
ncbi:N-acetylgalactosaminyltransferase 6 [Portunus trituberculatus]|uniref:N-acetylgalactosaminyltransferase 6 n=2 Tax=Portunus trituberculatus TaxID=210409 RepID=A0A5B7CMX8_PORTR|nr:N-acetylgalactosaminyltransferase 6 [Portunus trituberculatus]